jgi:hypothetical protein
MHPLNDGASFQNKRVVSTLLTPGQDFTRGSILRHQGNPKPPSSGLLMNKSTQCGQRKGKAGIGIGFPPPGPPNRSAKQKKSCENGVGRGWCLAWSEGKGYIYAMTAMLGQVVFRGERRVSPVPSMLEKARFPQPVTRRATYVSCRPAEEAISMSISC